jgi:hypothetical protein
MQLSFTRLGFCGTVATLEFGAQAGDEPSKPRGRSISSLQSARASIGSTLECNELVGSSYDRRSVAAFQAEGGGVSRNIIVNSGFPAYAQNISKGPHQLFADEPAKAGGADEGPNPYDLVMAALGACTSMTVRMYAERRNWRLEKVQVDLTFSRIHAADCDDCSREQNRDQEYLLWRLVRGPTAEASARR